jgi:hypothetical protein
VVSLVGALADDLVAGMAQSDGAPRSILLWLDEDGQFSRLRGALEGELAGRDVTLLALDPGGSQVQVKLALLEIEAQGARAVVHVPHRPLAELRPGKDGRPPALWAFVEYCYKGAIWGVTDPSKDDRLPTLDAWLSVRGVRFSGGGARRSVSDGGADSRLARAAAHHAFSDLSQFPQPVNQQSLNVVGEARDLAIDLLMDPEGAAASWADDATDARQMIESTYGVTFTGASPDTWASELAVHLGIVDAWDALGRAPDFPFAQRLPAEDVSRAAALSLIRKGILVRADAARRLRSLVQQRVSELSGLVAWARSRTGTPASIPAIVEQRIGDTLKQIDGAASTDDALAAIETATKGTSSGTDPRFDVLIQVADLGRRASAERKALTGSADAAALAGRYAEKSWGIDIAFLEVSAACREHASMAPARRLAQRVYATYLDAVNQRFGDLIEADGPWPPVGTRSIRDEAEEIWSRPAKPRERRAVIIVDALRLDLARQLEARLGPSSELRPVLSTLPSTTPFGMTALLPLEDSQIGVATGTKSVQLFDESQEPLQERAGRKDLLAKLVEGRGDAIAFVEVESLLQGEVVPPTRYVVAFTYALDDRGHSKADAASLPEVASQLPERLARVIERLHQAGIARVDVVTDHGFLWLDPEDVDSLGTPSVPTAQVSKKAARYAILAEGASAPELMHLPLPFDPDVVLGFPRGIRTLSKATWYLHGGVSLQETVIPHLISRATDQQPRLRVAVTVPNREISGATIPVRVAPDLSEASGQLSLGGPTPIQVRLTATTNIGTQELSVAEPTVVEVRGDSPELRTALYLLDDRALPAGTVITIAADDEATRERLYDCQVTLTADWG